MDASPGPERATSGSADPSNSASVRIDDQCWICRCTITREYCEGVDPSALRPEDLRISDKRYGLSLPLRQCLSCGFVFTSRTSLPDLTALYRGLDDPEYETSEYARRRQMTHLLRSVRRDIRPPARLLDVGAASGLLVEEATRLGFDAVGIEPSRHLVDRARAAGLPVHEGVLPHDALDGECFDALTLVDVIEHVDRPLELLRQCRRSIVPGGHLLVVTPDRRSVAARVLRRRWWHRRIAHVCYFDRPTLTAALHEAGFRPVRWTRPRWYLPVGYLYQRILEYVPRTKAIARRAPAAVRVVVPFNLRDSYAVVARAS